MRSTITTGSHLETVLGTATLAVVGERVFSSGLIPAQRGSAVSETRQVYEAAANVMHRAGSSLADVVRVRAWFTNGNRSDTRHPSGVVRRPRTRAECDRNTESGERREGDVGA